MHEASKRKGASPPDAEGGYTEHTTTTGGTRRLPLPAAYYMDRLVQAASTGQQHGSTAKEDVRVIWLTPTSTYAHMYARNTPKSQQHTHKHTTRLRRQTNLRGALNEREPSTQNIKHTNRTRTRQRSLVHDMDHPRVIPIFTAAHLLCNLPSSS